MTLKIEYRSFYKLWLIKAQIHEELCQLEEVRSTYDKALQVDTVRSERIIWLEAARFEERQEAFTRARTILQKARAKMPSDALIWLASIKLEVTCDNERIA
mmetsp:Transcript_35814/g.47127  ORF Transcript_35814/g.47127 Transcript_35814/m.47127 type:complete len:101 (+) Transcript_35814:1161-1463(+)